MFSHAMATESTMEKVSAPKNFPMLFNSLSAKSFEQSPCPLFPGARELVSVAIPFDQLRKRGVRMKDVNVSHGKTKMDKMVRRRVTLCSSLKNVV
jgi:hypothetical protein